MNSWWFPPIADTGRTLRESCIRVWRQNRHLLQIGEHMQALMDSIPDLTWVKDTQSRFMFVNAQFGKTFGRQPKSLVGLTDYHLSAPDSAAAYIADDQLVLQMASPCSVRRPLPLKMAEAQAVRP